MKKMILVLVFLTGCSTMSDTRLLRKTNAIYASAVARYDAKCVTIPEPKAPVECVTEDIQLTSTRRELIGYMQAFLLGPLPPSARLRLIQIQNRYEPVQEEK